MVLLLLACAHRAPDHGAPTPGAASPGTAVTAAAAPEGAAETTPAASPCGPWSGVVRVGTRWTYGPTDAYRERHGMDGAFTVEVAALEGAFVELSQRGHYRAPEGGSFSWTRTDTWRCDADGAALIASEGRSRGRSGSDKIAFAGSRRIEPGWRVRPAMMAPWSETFTETVAVNGTAQPPRTIACSTTMTGEGTREVGGRVVAARHLTPTCTDGLRDPMWLGEGIGLVENADERLLSYEP